MNLETPDWEGMAKGDPAARKQCRAAHQKNCFYLYMKQALEETLDDFPEISAEQALAVLDGLMFDVLEGRVGALKNRVTASR